MSDEDVNVAKIFYKVFVTHHTSGDSFGKCSIVHTENDHEDFMKIRGLKIWFED